MQRDLTQGPITAKLLRFAVPLMIGNLLQQFYNIADTWIVGQFLGADALAAVGSSYTLMVFLTSILLGLCMGSGAVFSIYYGKKDGERLKSSIFLSFVFIGTVTLVLNAGVFAALMPVIRLLQVPPNIVPLMRDYLWVIFWGIPATFLYNYFSNLLRAVGNSVTPLVFLGVAAVLNIFLDLLFVLGVGMGVEGAAAATVISQYLSGAGMMGYTLLRFPELRIQRRHIGWKRDILQEIMGLSFLTCVQQSVMNFGILMVQGLVNSFGAGIMAAFAAAVKIDSFAYMPVQDFGNAFSTFVAQNYGAGKTDRIRKGIRSAAVTVFFFCTVISSAVCLFARPLMGIFISAQETGIIEAGVHYLRIEGACYIGIGLLFLLYGFYRAVHRPGMSVVLTVISLGTRVALAYLLSSVSWIGVTGIWVSVPIGWLLADITGIGWYWFRYRGNYAAAL
ncbi:MAG TPA: MATE family efflux transporter [Lachnospiraceae bacterium]|nr:MATE family efflux transporter [Lachnospiraceae bacterium]